MGSPSVEEYKALLEKIQYHDHLYHVESAPEISDAAYDALVRKKEAVQAALGIDEGSSSEMAESFHGFERIKHEEPMLSLMNAYTTEEIKLFFERIQKASEKDFGDAQLLYTLEMKIDGLAVSLVYKNCQLVQALTRGDGWIGDNIIANVRQIKDVPQTLPPGSPENLVVRGEIFMLKKTFSSLNKERKEKGLEPWANPRNLVAGSVRSLDPGVVAKRSLSFLGYGVLHPREYALTSQGAVVTFLENMGIPALKSLYTGNTLSEIEACLVRVEQAVSLEPFNIDGVVIKLDHFPLRERLGSRAKHPRWALAYKFPQQAVATRVERIVVQVGRSGVLTPVAEVMPVHIGGSTVSRATLHNVSEIFRKDIREGDGVWVEKGGEVIPVVLGVIKERRQPESRPWAVPTFCPSCSGAVSYQEGDVHAYCLNTSCPGRLLQRLVHFAGKYAMDIAHLGERVLDKLIKASLLHSLADLYHLQKEQLYQIGSFQKTAAERLLQSIEASKNQPLHAFLTALGIPGVGQGTAQLLSVHFPSVEQLFQVSEPQLVEIEGIGPVVATSVVAFFRDPINVAEIQELLSAGVEPLPPKGASDGLGGALLGKCVVITGTLPTLTRKAAEQLVIEQGGRVLKAISKNVDILLKGMSPGSKAKEAAKFPHIVVWDENQFKKELKKENATQ